MRNNGFFKILWNNEEYFKNISNMQKSKICLKMFLIVPPG